MLPVERKIVLNGFMYFRYFHAFIGLKDSGFYSHFSEENEILRSCLLFTPSIDYEKKISETSDNGESLR
jgi:hypothetical protein